MISSDKLLRAADILKDEGCSAVYLFGSQLTGKAHNGSDVDFDYQADFFALLQRVGEVRKIG